MQIAYHGRWEMAPLGPFLAKNFATTVSPWIVTMDALAPYRTNWKRAANEPQPLDYFKSAHNRETGALDIRLQLSLQSAAARATNRPPPGTHQRNDFCASILVDRADAHASYAGVGWLR